MTKYYLLMTTVSTVDDGQQLAALAVESQLAACAQVQASCHSTYWWKGNIESALEIPVHFKTKEECLGQLIDLVQKNHKYDVPEIVAIEINTLSPSYAQWLSESLAIDL